ncbi:hypothetical protein PIB30_090587, partial [Stylosanthes scabra]|nr:hypothetical protein [Stylosanthes scabra]
MDIDFVNYGDLVKLLESIGFNKFKKLKWYDFVEDVLERGLHPLNGDVHINEMCEHLMRNIGLVNEFHVYVEHEVDVPIPAEVEREPEVEEVVVEKVLSSSSSSTDDGGYESADDELYKPPL